MIAGFDVGGTNARGILMDPSGERVVNRVNRPSTDSGPELVQTLSEMLSELCDRNHMVIDSVGLAIAGLAHKSGVVRYSPNLAGLIEFPIGPELASAIGQRVTLINDATAGAWAEMKFGAGRGLDNFIFVALGTGIGTGFVVDGRLVLGENGFAGESGHIVIDCNGPEHITGQRGPWEYFASGNALGRLGREAASEGRFAFGEKLAGSIAHITGVHVAEGLHQKDHESMIIFDGFCREVARGVANLVLILDPGSVILGGGLSEIGSPLCSGINTWLQQLLPGQAFRPGVEVTLSELGLDASSIGAALLSISSSSSTTK